MIALLVSLVLGAGQTREIEGFDLPDAAATARAWAAAEGTPPPGVQRDGDSVGQDWVVWVKAGYLDFVCPMDCTACDQAFGSLVAEQVRLVGGRVPVYPGIGVSAVAGGLAPDRVAGQIQVARARDAGGFVVFNLDQDTSRNIAPAVGAGAASQPAVPPHRAAEH